MICLSSQFKSDSIEISKQTGELSRVMGKDMHSVAGDFLHGLFARVWRKYFVIWSSLFLWR